MATEDLASQLLRALDPWDNNAHGSDSTMPSTTLRPLLCLAIALGLLLGDLELQGAAPEFRFTTHDGALCRVIDGTNQPLFVHAVNLSVAVPGTQPGELAATREQYDRWIARIRGMGFNAIRTYTLHYPRFYAALQQYNLAHPDAPLYLLQGVWLDEENPWLDLHDLTSIFEQGIRECVGAVHGAISIPHRFGRAYGDYTNDVSPWMLGWIIGREVYPAEVDVTDTRHPEDTQYAGARLSLPSGSPTESWIAARLDYLASHEIAEHNQARPISFSSWPTLDPLTHPTESQLSYEDTHSIDLANLDTSNYPAGYFASYHAYPYYPDWMSEDVAYTNYVDATGPNSYLGYLHALRAHYYPKPLFIAEFGVPSSWGNAHVAQSGMHHGGHDEVAQGLFAIRMFENIADAQCAGGALFAWIDEWWKNSWITSELDFPLLRRPLWLNVTASEQNYGLIAFEDSPPQLSAAALTGSPGTLATLHWAASHRFLHLEIQTDTTTWPLVIGFDTYGDALGESILPGGTPSPARCELALVLDPNTGSNPAQLLVTQAYDLFGIWHGVSTTNQLYHSIATDGQPWVPVKWLSNRAHASDDLVHQFPATIDEIGRLQVSFTGSFDSSRDAVAITNGLIQLRLPWTLLQFTDPSSRAVMDDNRTTDGSETAVSEGVRLVLVQGTGLATTERLSWATWEAATATTEREKASLPILEQYLLRFNGTGEIRMRIIAVDSTSLTLEWTGGGALESAPTPSGPWAKLGPGSPATVLHPFDGAGFYRVTR